MRGQWDQEPEASGAFGSKEVLQRAGRAKSPVPHEILVASWCLVSHAQAPSGRGRQGQRRF